jgi:hypothetical protein
VDPVRNPYSPGAGAPPPELAGRDFLRDQVRTAIARITLGNPAKSVLMVGLRGVGKTVLLDQMRQEAEDAGVLAVRMEVPEGRSLAALLAPALRGALLKLSRVEKAKSLAERGLRALAGFAKSLKVKFDDIQVSLDLDPEPGLADNGDLELDLIDLLEAVGKAARKAGVAVVLFIDELQYLKEQEFAVLISALHRCSQSKLPVTVVGAGLPQLVGLAGKAKSYSERLFDYPVVGPLTKSDAEVAILKPAQAEDVDFEPKALEEIITATQCYPYFLQEWGKHAWDVAAASPITLEDVKEASRDALTALDESFFRVRFDRLTPYEKRYLRAMAELGAGPHRSGDIAQVIGRQVEKTSPVRASLIRKGMIWSPSHGDTAFTVPLFEDYMKRIMPGDEWRD